MKTFHFDRSALPPARTFYEDELGEFRRSARGWAAPKAGCPFHESKSKTSFRVNFDNGAFRCFGCGAHGGDVLAFVRLRYRLDFKDAAKQLGAWTDINSPEAQERQRQRDEEAERKERERSERLNVRNYLHAVETLYQKAIAEHDRLSMS